MKKAFVAGWPIAQSKSPQLHGFWLKQYGIVGSYEKLEVPPDQILSFLDNLPRSDFVGGNVTIPHKETAFAHISNCDETAELIGAINTVWVEEEEIHAANTDAYGFMANLDQFCPEWRDMKTATVLGAGGASRAIIAALIQAGYSQIQIANRTLERAKAIADHFGKTVSAHSLDAAAELLPDTNLLVNTSSIGMEGQNTESLPDLDHLPDDSIVTDIVYKPLITPLLKMAQERNLKTVDGLGMLLHQAVPGFEKWFGKRPEVTNELRLCLLEN